MTQARSHTAFCLLTLLTLFAGAILHAQPRNAGAGADGAGTDSTRADTVRGPIVTAIAFIGNDVTDSDIILREMTLHKGDAITPEAIAESKSRIYNLGLFNSVSITYPPMDSTVLIVEVTERWYLWPVPLFGIVDKDWSHWYYGLGVQHWNVAGRAERIFAGGVLGYNPWASAAYSNPWVLGPAQLFTNTEVKFQRYENKNILTRGSVPHFDENHFTFDQTIGKRLDRYRNVWAFFGFQYVHVTDPSTMLTVSPTGIDRSLYFGIGASHDTRDYKDYTMKGVNSAVSIEKRGFGVGEVDYLSYRADLRVYQPVFGGTSLCARVFTRVVSGPAIPAYDNVFFGFGERIRGHFKERLEGQDILGASLEWRIPILSPRQMLFSFVPVKQFRNWRFGVYGALFADAGNVWYKHQSPKLSASPSGYGVGVHFLLPYGFVFRLEYALNELGRGQFIYDVTASF